MAYELKPGSGTLFENDRKQTDSHPDMTGSINIDGTEHWFSGWWKQGSKGQFLSVSVGKPKDKQPGQQPPAARPAPAQRPGQRQPSRDMTPRAAHQHMNSHGFDEPDSDIPW